MRRRGMPEDDQLLGLSEAADLLRTSRQALGNWRQRREGFPRPIAELKSGPVWRRADLVEWANANGVVVAELDGADDTTTFNGAGTTIALMNMKGGVGKSTLTANLGWFCAQKQDQRVLLVDLDPQFNLSQYVMGTDGYEKHLEADKGSVLDIFEQATPPSVSGKAKKREVRPENIIAPIKSWADGSRMDLVPSSLELSWTLKNPSGKEQLLTLFLDEVRSSYDLILIDCAPTESMLTTAAYLASDSVLVPVKPEFLSTIGLPLVVKSLDDFARLYKQSVDVLGIVFNASADKLEHGRSRSFVRKVAKEHGWYVFRHEMSYSDSYPKGSRSGTPIFQTDYARYWKIEDFYAVAEEFVGRLTP
jgi:chromosome partitioning protein